MKKLLALMASVLLVSTSCTKNASTSCHNTVTVTDGSNTYSACGDGHLGAAGQINAGVIIAFHNGTTNSLLDVYAAKDYPFSINIQDSLGPITGTGIYTLQAIDSNENLYAENYIGGQTYKCSGGAINVTRCDTSNISGTFTLNLFNSAGSKIISGTFNANAPDYY